MSSIHIWLGVPVLVLGLYALVYSIRGWVGKRPYERKMWDLASLFTFTLYVQVVTGFLLIFSTTNRAFDRSLGVHMILSMAAAALAQMTYSANRRRVREERRYVIHVWGVGGALLLVLLGILALRASLLD